MKVSGEWLEHEGTQAFCRALAEHHFQALFVGGCVRNALLGVAVNDVDIATDALPETVTNIAETAGFRVVPTGLKHGTVTVLAMGAVLEVTTFRQDVETDGRHATVAFSRNILDDAQRRDFTMNALYANADGDVVDPLGGLPDLLARRLRFVGEAEARITEDYLRILRFFRFHAIYADPDGGIDAEGMAACAANSAMLETISKERIGSELCKLLNAANPAPAMAAMQQAGVLAQILPGADVTGLAPLVHLEAGLAPRWQRRLAVIGGENAEAALRLTRQDGALIRQIRDEIGGVRSVAALSWLMGDVCGRDTVLCRAALLEQPIPENLEADLARGVAAQFPITASDLMPTLTGPALGGRLRQLQARWLSSDLTLQKAQLLDG